MGSGPFEIEETVNLSGAFEDSSFRGFYTQTTGMRGPIRLDLMPNGQLEGTIPFLVSGGLERRFQRAKP